MMRSNLRWCSDGLEFSCWNGDVIRLAFLIDAHGVSCKDTKQKEEPGRTSP
jgi:hypothetical protein